MLKNLFMTSIPAIGGSDAANTIGAISDKAEASFTFMPGEFVNNLSYMGIGMLSIFIVIGVIVVAISVLDRVVRAAGKK